MLYKRDERDRPALAAVKKPMLTNNPMKDAAIARKVSETSKARF